VRALRALLRALMLMVAVRVGDCNKNMRGDSSAGNFPHRSDVDRPQPNCGSCLNPRDLGHDMPMHSFAGNFVHHTCATAVSPKPHNFGCPKDLGAALLTCRSCGTVLEIQDFGYTMLR